jgi:hypothetical protein
LDGLVRTDTAVETFPAVAIPAQSLKVRRIAFLFQPSVKLLTSPAASLSSMRRSIVFRMVYRQKIFIRFSAARTFSTVRLERRILYSFALRILSSLLNHFAGRTHSFIPLFIFSAVIAATGG